MVNHLLSRLFVEIWILDAFSVCGTSKIGKTGYSSKSSLTIITLS